MMFFQRVICPTCGMWIDLHDLNLKQCKACYHPIPLTAKAYGTNIKSGAVLGDLAAYRIEKTLDEIIDDLAWGMC